MPRYFIAHPDARLPCSEVALAFAAKVFHRDLKPKNILANADCKLKVCDFGLARPSFNDMPTTIFWTDYVATRWWACQPNCFAVHEQLGIVETLKECTPISGVFVSTQVPSARAMRLLLC